jgi:hypothetical protein
LVLFGANNKGEAINAGSNVLQREKRNRLHIFPGWELQMGKKHEKFKFELNYIYHYRATPANIDIPIVLGKTKQFVCNFMFLFPYFSNFLYLIDSTYTIITNINAQRTAHTCYRGEQD